MSRESRFRIHTVVVIRASVSTRPDVDRIQSNRVVDPQGLQGPGPGNNFAWRLAVTIFEV